MSKTSTTPATAVFLVFLLANAVLLFAAQPDASIGEPDARRYLELAQKFLDEGTLWTPQDGRQSLVALPLYPMFVAGCLWISNNALWMVVVAQVLLVFLTGIFAFGMAKPMGSGVATVVFALTTLSPNAISQAHRLNNDTLFAFLFVAAVYLGIRYFRAPQWRFAVGSGALLGLSYLVRFEAHYVILALPFVFPLMALLIPTRQALTKYVIGGVLALGAAVLVLQPWMAEVSSKGHGWRMSDGSNGSIFLRGNVFILERYSGRSTTEASQRLNDKLEAYIEEHRGEAPLQQLEQSFWIRQLLSYPLATTLEAFAFSSINFFVAAGSQSLSNLVGARFERSDKVFHDENRVDAMVEGLRNQSPTAIALSAYGLLFTLGARLLGLIGLYVLIRRRQWFLLATIVGFVGYFWLSHLLVGLARYRLPVEPLLFILAAIGASIVFPKRRNETES